MIISNCSRPLIEAAITKHDFHANITSLSPTGLRHRVKLYPSYNKTIKVAAGTRTFYSQTVATRDRLHRIFADLAISDNPTTFLEELALTPETFAHIPAPVLANYTKLAKIICGKQGVVYKKIAQFQSKAPNTERAVAAVCWHGFKAFFESLFTTKPDARAYTAYAKYLGKDGFLANYPATAQRARDCWC